MPGTYMYCTVVLQYILVHLKIYVDSLAKVTNKNLVINIKTCNGCWVTDTLSILGIKNVT